MRIIAMIALLLELITLIMTIRRELNDHGITATTIKKKSKKIWRRVKKDQSQSARPISRFKRRP